MLFILRRIKGPPSTRGRRVSQEALLPLDWEIDAIVGLARTLTAPTAVF